MASADILNLRLQRVVHKQVSDVVLAVFTFIWKKG